MFDTLEERFQGVLKKVRGHGTLSEDNIKEALREVRLSLLEADVHFRVVKQFVESVRTKALGQEVSRALNPSQQFIRVVGETLTETMGGTATELDLRQKPPVVILLCGLQGAGKTTTAAKLALRLKSANGRKPLLLPADVHRPAAIEQLKSLGRNLGLDVHDSAQGASALSLVEAGLAQAARQGHDVVIVDTAGRLQIDPEMMEELRELKEAATPHYTLLVVDAMTGQEAVNVASEFNAQVQVDGLVLTKLDGDARGGAALSARWVTGVPIYFAGMGEKPDQFEVFHPDRIAQRILGMGDMMSLIEKSQAAYDEKKAEKMAKKIKKADFSFDDFREQMEMMQKMGDMKSLLSMIPGAAQAMKKMGGAMPDPDKELKRISAIIDSMTPLERAKPDVLNPSRRRRIARGSGMDIQQVNQFIKRFKDARKMMKKFSKMGPGGLKNLMRGMPGM